MKVKIFAATNCPDLEKLVNEFIASFSNPGYRIIKMHYSTDQMYYSVMIEYIP